MSYSSPLFLPKELVTLDMERLLEISDYKHWTVKSKGMVYVEIRMPLRAVNGDLSLQRCVRLAIGLLF